MKKILFGILFFIIQGFITVSAVSINDLQNMSRYIKMEGSITQDVYIDRNSVAVVRYDPPFYIIQGTTIGVYYNDNKILTMKTKFYYDYLLQEIQYQYIQGNEYTFNGDNIATIDFQEKTLRSRMTNMHSAVQGDGESEYANFFFSLCYNMPFYRNEPTI